MKKTEFMKGIFLRPGWEPCEMSFRPDLATLQMIVCNGGYLEAVHEEIPTTGAMVPIIILCDEDGRLKGQPYNCRISAVDYVGNLLIVGSDLTGDITDIPITVSEWKHYQKVGVI